LLFAALVIATVLVLGGTFALALRGVEGFAALAGVLLAALAVATGFGVLVSLLWFTTLRCDDGCVRPEDRGPHTIWTQTDDAWQWPAQFILALLAFAAVAGACYAVFTERTRLGAALAAGWLGLVIAFALMWSPAGNALGI
jgi:hypothetical protein